MAVEKLHLAHRIYRGHEPGNVVDDMAPGGLFGIQSVVRSFMILRCSATHLPRHYTTQPPMESSGISLRDRPDACSCHRSSPRTARVRSGIDVNAESIVDRAYGCRPSQISRLERANGRG